MSWVNVPSMPESLVPALDGRLFEAVRLAILAGFETLKYFQTDAYRIERKRDNSPVTTADKVAEQLIRSKLATSFPNDGILGEEFGGQTGQAEFEWIVDPIDGTKSFISGVPLYSTLIGVTQHGQSQVGVIFIPGLNEIIAACRGYGAWWSRAGRPWSQAKVSRQSSLSDGLFVLSQVDNFDARGAAAGYRALEKTAYITRSWGDGYGYLLVATGRAEVMVDPIVNPWDVAAVMPVVEEAGGRCTSWKGESTIHGGDCIGSNGLVHEEVLRCLQG
jgi:histidinol phosphatase-like enzyme (inositol monophosphatase family)